MTNSYVTIKVGGRFRELPTWAIALSFELRPTPGFDRAAWVLWKPTLESLDRVNREKKLKLQWVRIHSHLGVKKSPTHAMGWADKEEKTMFLCHFDKETMLHEAAHILTIGSHSDKWAKTLFNLYEEYLPAKQSRKAQDEMGRYLSGRRVYLKKYGVKAPKHLDEPSIWIGTKKS